MGFEGFALGQDVQAAGRGQLGGLFRNETDDVGTDGQGCGFHLRRGGHFDGELGFDRLPEEPDVPLVDVAAVAAKVDGDAGRSGLFGQESGQDGLGLGRPPSLAQAGDMIDVDG